MASQAKKTKIVRRNRQAKIDRNRGKASRRNRVKRERAGEILFR